MKYFFLLLLGVLGLSPLTRAQPKLANGVAVIVNDVVITYKDVQNLITRDLEFLERRYAGQPKMLEQKINELTKERIEELVESQLILHEFETKGHKLPESYIEARINQDIRDRLTLTKTLQSQGLTYEAYRKKVRENIIVEAMWRHNISDEVLISPHKIEMYYVENKEKFKVDEQVKLRMIVLTNRPNDKLFSPTKMAQEIVQKVKDGAPFAEMAKIYSQGSQAVEGGDWGWVEKQVLRKDLSEKAFGMKPGELALVESTEAAYIMLVENRQPAHIKSLSEVREEIESTLKAEENKRLRKKWLDRLRTKSFIQYFVL
jgi:peptidyl-prolyl cis-trans isomerase SurA